MDLEVARREAGEAVEPARHEGRVRGLVDGEPACHKQAAAKQAAAEVHVVLDSRFSERCQNDVSITFDEGLLKAYHIRGEPGENFADSHHAFEAMIA